MNGYKCRGAWKGGQEYWDGEVTIWNEVVMEKMMLDKALKGMRVTWI